MEEKAQSGMDLYKYPRTRHLFDAGGSGVSRDDLLMDAGEEAAFYSSSSSSSSKKPKQKASPSKDKKGGRLVAMEEKVDGANLGISLSAMDLTFKVQNRSHYINSKTHRQFSQLDIWLVQHSSGLFDILGDEPGRYVLFGEWLYAAHSIEYTRIPDYFLAFDIFDHNEGRFFSWRERNRRLEGTGIETVRLIAEETLGGRADALKWLDTKSEYYDGPIEGIYLRMDEDMASETTPEPKPAHRTLQFPGDLSTSEPAEAADTRSPLDELLTPDPPQVYNLKRGKLVRPDFLQGIDEQWTKKHFKKNIVHWA